ncbi:MAG TPA: hypothetical protein VE175_08895 [Woeseiaceae bacterium]|nr:hypothetical protein [Woeseiaceae bacterium]
MKLLLPYIVERGGFQKSDGSGLDWSSERGLKSGHVGHQYATAD